MSDTQWPRFQVFHQSRPDAPHEDAGTVHAPDAELALLNARDVFARRPDCSSLWVVPSDAITSRTAEELGSNALSPAPDGEGDPETYLVFAKRSQRGAHEYVGRVTASAPEKALRQAIASLQIAHSLGWWVFPEKAMRRSDEGEERSFFGPAEDKPYRNQSFYHTDTLMRELLRKRAKGHESK